MITISQKTTFTWNRSQGKTKAEHPNGPHFPQQFPNCLKFCACRTFPVQCPKLVVGVHGKDMLEAVSTQLLPTQPSAGKFASAGFHTFVGDSFSRTSNASQKLDFQYHFAAASRALFLNKYLLQQGGVFGGTVCIFFQNRDPCSSFVRSAVSMRI